MMNADWLADERSLVSFEKGQVHCDLVEPLEQLREDARRHGFELQIVSAFRSVDRQLDIWNQKANGKRVITDAQGQVLDPAQMDEEACLFAILKYSALPGTSRHHWGTDFDVVDAAALCDGYKVALTQQETEGDGVFAAMHAWLDVYLRQQTVPFFRPYPAAMESSLRVGCEPWHLSYAPRAKVYQRHMKPDALKAFVASLDIALKPVILAKFDEIFEQYIWVPWHHYLGKDHI